MTPIARLRGQHHHLQLRQQQEKRQQEGGGVSCGYESPEDDRLPPGMSSALGPRRVQSSPGPGPAPRSNNKTGLRGYSLNGVLSRTKNMRDPGRKVGIRDRIKCFQWTWFTMTMVCDCLVVLFSSFRFLFWSSFSLYSVLCGFPLFVHQFFSTLSEIRVSSATTLFIQLRISSARQTFN